MAYEQPAGAIDCPNCGSPQSAYRDEDPKTKKMFVKCRVCLYDSRRDGPR